MQTCINFIEQGIKFSHFEGSIITYITLNRAWKLKIWMHAFSCTLKYVRVHFTYAAFSLKLKWRAFTRVPNRVRCSSVYECAKLKFHTEYIFFVFVYLFFQNVKNIFSNCFKIFSPICKWVTPLRIALFCRYTDTLCIC